MVAGHQRTISYIFKCWWFKLHLKYVVVDLSLSFPDSALEWGNEGSSGARRHQSLHCAETKDCALRPGALAPSPTRPFTKNSETTESKRNKGKNIPHDEVREDIQNGWGAGRGLEKSVAKDRRCRRRKRYFRTHTFSGALTNCPKLCVCVWGTSSVSEGALQHSLTLFSQTVSPELFHNFRQLRDDDDGLHKRGIRGISAVFKKNLVCLCKRVQTNYSIWKTVIRGKRNKFLDSLNYSSLKSAKK